MTFRSTAPLVFALAPALATAAAAQIRSPGVPASVRAPLPTDVPAALMPAPDVEAHLAQDALSSSPMLRYGALIETSLDLQELGRFDSTPDETGVWRLRIRSPGAHSLGLEFSEFALPPGAELYLTDAVGRTVFGAYTRQNHQSNGQLVIEPFPGDTVTVELDLPAGSVPAPRVRIGAVIHDYRDVRALMQTGGDGSADGSCLLDANCPSGVQWAVQKRSAVKTLSGGGACSGGLLNNTAADGTGYVLCANHCGQGTNTVFIFNYENSGCGTSDASESQSVSGCTILVADAALDHRLLRIDSPIPAAYAPVYAGWSRSSANSTFAFSFGHPQGGPKKLTVDANGAIKSATQWVVTWSEGLLLGSSSGSPLFDQNGRVRGPAYGITGSDCGQTAVYYRFDLAYPADGLGQWLDPLGLNPTAIDAYDPFGTGGPTAPSITGFTPAAVPALGADTSSFAIQGLNFVGVNTVKLNGVALAPGAFTVTSGTSISVAMPLPSVLGPMAVEISGPHGSDSDSVAVVACDPPVVDLLSSVPSALFNFAGMTMRMSSEPGDFAFLLASPDNVPSVLPGLVTLGIGSGFTTLVSLGTHPIDGDGWAQFATGPLSLPAGTNVFVQIAAFPSESGDLTEASNVQQGLIAF